eukprot:CAMPEP_0197020336 /NCGR_PEP_ID=MMETSP1384-20130603/1093_1 /TAXON_ID=29189 /ORGANISM="Ammonia sp." /LENGTH=650 /DNA_ID=CAMNT_0042447943 /DNA_START=30 /DNA_END=1982 /DNA_ORIENTATION=+
MSSPEQLAAEWIAIVVLCLFSGLFSGLNLGLMGLDPVDLEVVMSGDEPGRSYAKKIKPVRDCGNWLLCTLLLGNVAVNAALSILLADKTDKVFGFLASTLIIVVFGEIIPQAVCSRYALLVGAYTVNIVYALMVIFSVIAYPIAMILDKILGQEIGMLYSRAELRKLIDLHAQHADPADPTVKLGTANIMKGALDLQETAVSDVMTKIDDVFSLPEDAKLDFDVLTQIFKSGHSRIPIIRRNNDRLHIVGVLYSKDLILLDPDDEISVTHFLNAFRYKKPIFIPADTTLDRCLKIFTLSRTHLCMVKEGSTEEHRRSEHERRISIGQPIDNELSAIDGYLPQHRYAADANNKHEKDDNAVIIGVITLEDVIEHALQTEIVDEHDAFVDHKHLQQTNRMAQIDWSILNLFDHRHKMLTSLPPQELQAVYHFLGQSVRVFMPKLRNCSESSIKNLLLSSAVVKVDTFEPRASSDSETVKRNQRDPYKDIETNGLLLYERDKKTEYFTLILDGKCEIYAGRQGFRSTLSRWTYLCPDALEAVEQCVLTGKPLLDYVPDFTCKVLENARVLRIRLSDFQGCLQGKFDGFNNQFPGRGFSEPVPLAFQHNLTIPGTLDEHRKSEPSDPDIQSPRATTFTYRKNENTIFTSPENRV